MVIWTGSGGLTVLIAIAGVLVGELLEPLVASFSPAVPVTTGLAIGLIVASVFNWFIGLQLNRRPGRKLIDPNTGGRVVLRRRHTLFRVPMQSMSRVLLFVAVFVLFSPA